eukprot:202726-Chlamydomonas_euryale.AAC.1
MLVSSLLWLSLLYVVMDSSFVAAHTLMCGVDVILCGHHPCSIFMGEMHRAPIFKSLRVGSCSTKRPSDVAAGFHSELLPIWGISSLLVIRGGLSLPVGCGHLSLPVGCGHLSLPGLALLPPLLDLGPDRKGHEVQVVQFVQGHQPKRGKEEEDEAGGDAARKCGQRGRHDGGRKYKEEELQAVHTDLHVVKRPMWVRAYEHQ